ARSGKTLFAQFPPVKENLCISILFNNCTYFGLTPGKAAVRSQLEGVKRRMHALFSKANALTETIIAAAIEVHRDKGPGLIESIYEWCLLKELELRGIPFSSQQMVQVTYKGFIREEPLRFDILVDDCLLVEGKAVEKVLPLHKAKLLSYMKLLDF